MPFSYDILDGNAWATDDQAQITPLVTENDDSGAAWRNEEEPSGQPASTGDEAQASTSSSNDQTVCTECEECPAVCELFKSILDPDPSNLETLHRDDDDSLWFSVDGDTGSLQLREFPRFGAIVSEHQRQHSPESPPYPRLVSFIGKTGEGKSAIIRLLIERVWDETARRRMAGLGLATKTPVVGPRQRSIPTSGDVHLYCDTLMDENEAVGRPLLYADCEGFGAGTQRPTSHQGQRYDSWTSVPGLPNIRRWQEGWRYIANGFRRPLPAVERRQDAVRYLFPKLLYNFSDVVVNVMQSHSLQQIDDSIVELLEWAEVSHVSAINRFGLPHLIIVINRSDTDSDWDPFATGQQILNEQQRVLEGNDRVKAMAGRFRGVGIKINTLEDLLLTSYASVQFIRLPQGREAVLCLSTQLAKLHRMIYQSSNLSLDEKLHRRMLLSAPSMDEFFNLAFDHFSNKVNEPFDFLAQLISLRVPPAKMAARLSELMIATFRALETSGDRNSLVSRFCAVVTPLVSSVMALDAARSFESLPGRWVDIFCGETDETTQSSWGSNKNSYKVQVIEAFELFTSVTLECEFQDESGRQCVNKNATHQCHQNSQGVVIGKGPYESQLSDELMVQWENGLYSRLETLDQEIDSQDTPQAMRNTTWRIHSSAVEGLYSAVESLDIQDLMVCSWCFCNDSSELLACGHGICNACLAEIAVPDSEIDQRIKAVHSCGLHNPSRLFDPPFHFFQLPDQISRRILSLDGDGAHGVIQTSILKNIENRLGGEIPIRHFFDLIGGSGTGGLLAIGIGIGDWDVDKCVNRLPNLVQAKDCMGRKHEQAIGDAFGQDVASQRIIGSRASTERAHAFESPTRVFVTTTLYQAGGEIQGPNIMANYLRPEGPEPKLVSYVYEAGHSDGQNLTLQDAARATSQNIYSDNHLSRRDVLYMDGGICCNNPAEIAMAEADIMWPLDRISASHLLLSIGNGWAEDADGPEDASNKDRSWMGLKIDELLEYFTSRPAELQRRLDQNRLSEKPWNEAFSLMSKKHPTRCVRLNPKISEKQTPEDIAAKYLSQEDIRLNITNFCHSLLATTFYFDATERHRQLGNGRYLIKGK
ncbi:hypothetical protein FPANT_12525 [Fusarium pseudoanthophilum]|uniref:PNPLA domain-containing protein n=1 Tax=Fusarium pseudoanthophilum TaxID=48495 RepID=A0A8H5KFA8_9HYPO|nr:hypothetical protein FPANT_12525 [Fusarium pseudoanthophilum]